MVADHRQDHLSVVRSTLAVGVYPVRVAVDFPFKASRWVSDTLTSREALLAENRQLREEQLLTKGRMEKYQHLTTENMRLRALSTDQDVIVLTYRVQLPVV